MPPSLWKASFLRVVHFPGVDCRLAAMAME